MPSATEIISIPPPNLMNSAPADPVHDTNRKQPWKKHWPPKEGTDKEKAYGFKKGAAIIIYGN